LLCTVAFAEVIDRIVAVVDGQIVTLSDLRQEREIRALLGETQIDDDNILAKQLVDTQIIQRQIADYPNIEVTEEEINAEVWKLNLHQVQNPRDPAGRDFADAQGRVLETPAARILDAIRSRIRSQKFFELKFRQSIRPTEDEVRKYYQDVFVPAAKARGVESIPLLTDPSMASAIRENVIQENLDHEVEVWLEAIRRRSKIEVFE
jgi:parvulin-like peptidyl-prolyl isomerase